MRSKNIKQNWKLVKIKKKYLVMLILLYVFQTQQINAQNWVETDKFVASNQMAGADFGNDVKTKYKHMVVGAPGHDNPGNDSSGAAYVYEKIGANWVEIQELTPNDLNVNDRFGTSVSISGEGKYVVVGAPGQDTDADGENPYSNSGAVYVFTRIADGSYVQTSKIVAEYANGDNDREANANFGWDVDIYRKTIIIGALKESHDISLPSVPNSGAAYIFDYIQTTGTFGYSWEMTAKLTATVRAEKDYFGFSVAINHEHVVIGAKGDDIDSNNESAGAAYVFENISGSNWIETEKLTATNRASDEHYGFSVDIDNIWIIVGAPQDAENENNNDSIPNAGSAFIYQKINGDWLLGEKIVANDRSKDNFFGASVALLRSYAVVGAPQNETDENNENIKEMAGAAYLFKPDGEGWIFDNKLVASDREDYDRFGTSVDINTSGQDFNAVVGAHNEDHDNDPMKVNRGSVYLFWGSFGFAKDHSGKTVSSSENRNQLSNPQILATPNPSSNNFTINVTDYDPKKNYIISVYDFTGKKILEESLKDFGHSINLESKANGIYNIIIYDGQNRTQLKVIKSN